MRSTCSKLATPVPFRPDDHRRDPVLTAARTRGRSASGLDGIDLMIPLFLHT
jgi:hypothetical protein